MWARSLGIGRRVVVTLGLCLAVAFLPSSAWATTDGASSTADPATSTAEPTTDPEPTPDPVTLDGAVVTVAPDQWAELMGTLNAPIPDDGGAASGVVTLEPDQWTRLELGLGAIAFASFAGLVASFGWGGRRG